MKQIATVKVGQLAVRYGEQAPAVTACCNACRTCITANLLTLLTAGVVAAWAPLARLGRRLRI
jgi:hypothetical protein